jgi:diguanylate cyclase (GGDEF)-like protein
LSWRRNVVGIGERALLVGKVEGCEIASWLLKRGMFRHAFSIVGMVASDDPTKHGMRLHGCWMLGGIGDLASLVKKHDIRVIIYTIPSMAAEISHIIFSLCKESNIQLIFLDDLLGLIDRHMDRPATSNEYSLWLEQRLESVSMHDALTGLPNRYLLQDRLRHTLVYAKRYNTKPAVLFIHLNGFELLTKNVGPTIGDEIVKLAAKRLANFKRESDTLARYDTHEFALILDNVADENTIETIANRLTALMSKPFVIKEGELSINVDIGIFRNEENGEDVRVLRNFDIETCFSRKQTVTYSGIKLVTKLDRDRHRGVSMS